MKLEHGIAPTIVQPTGARSEAQVSAREKAIAMLQGGQASPQAQQTPVRNANQVSPEEFQALQSEARQTETVETPSSEELAPAETAPVKEEAPLSSQYAVLARKQKEQRLRDQELRTREAKIKAAEDALKAPKAPEFDSSKFVDRQRLTDDPFAVLNELGLTYDQLTELALNAPKPEQLAMNNELRALKAEIAALRGESEKTQQSFKEQQEQTYKQAINEIRRETMSVVNSDPAFETIKASKSIDEVVSLIEKTYNEDGILMTVEEAARQVEEYLIEEAVKYAGLKKIQDRLAAARAPKTAPQSPQKTSTPPQGGMKTLTNSVTSSRPLTARERAIAAMEGRLK